MEDGIPFTWMGGGGGGDEWRLMPIWGVQGGRKGGNGLWLQ